MLGGTVSIFTRDADESCQLKTPESELTVCDDLRK